MNCGAPGDGLIESEADIVEHSRLVALDGEQVVGAAPEQILASARWVSNASAVTVRPAISGNVSSRGTMVPISLVRFSPSSASGLMPTFFAPRGLWSRGRRCRAHELFAIVIDGTAQGLAVDSQGAVTAAIGLMPCAQGGVELVGVDADEDAAHRRAARGAGVAVAPAHAEALQRLGAEVVDPFADGLVPAHATQRRGAGERQHRGQRMAPALAAAGVVDAVEERGQGTHLGGAEHHLRGSMAQVRGRDARKQPGPRGARQRVDEHPLRARVFAVAVARRWRRKPRVRPTSAQFAAR